MGFPALTGTRLGIDAKMPGSRSAGCWQKWPIKIKSAGFSRGTQTFYAGEPIFIDIA